MEKIDQLIHAKWIITCEKNNVLKNHALAIRNNKIHDILPSKEAGEKYTAAVEQHFHHHAITPGLINSHTHIAMNLFRGLADDLDLMEWLNKHIWPAEGKWVEDEFVYDASLFAMAEMIRCGTTCFNDMYFFMDATARAAEKAHMRAHIGMTIIDVPTAWAKTTDEYFAKAIEFYQHYKNHPYITPTLAPHSTYTLSKETLIRVKELADEYKLKINIHLQEAATEIPHTMAKYGLRPLHLLNEIGMVSPQLIAIHMTQLDESDFEILASKRPNIVHCPESNMKLASGACPVEKLAKLGINVALGTDGAASNNDLDMLSEIRSAALLGKLTSMDPKAMPAEYALKMATLHGARALGIDHFTGTLQNGKAADFIAIDLEQIEIQPVYHPISAIVYAASRQQVTDVWIAGKHLLKNRELQTLDEKELLAKVKGWRKKIGLMPAHS